MHSLQLGRGEFTVSEDLTTKVLCVSVISLRDISGDGLAVLDRQLKMASGPATTIQISIPRAANPQSSEEHNLGAVASICQRHTTQALKLKQNDTGTVVEIRLRG